MLRNRTVVYYAMPALPIALLGLPLYIYLPTFYAEEIGLGVWLVGALLFAARFADMLIDPLIGRLSDRLGRRQPMMAFGAVILLIGFYALTHPPENAEALWLFGFSILIYAGWSTLGIPYLALNAEISPDYHDKTRLASAREIAGILGVIVALTLPYLLNVADKAGATLVLMWQAIAVSLPVLLIISIYGVNEKGAALPDLAMLQGFRRFFRDQPNAVYLLWSYFLNNLANALPATLFLFFVERVIQRPEATGALLLLYFASGMIALPFWSWLARRTDKKRSWMLSMLTASGAFVFVPLLGEGDLVWFAVISLISGLSLGADMALPASIQSDMAQASDRGGNRLSGVLFGIWAMLTKLALALAVGIAFGTLALVDFVPEAPTPVALTALSLLYGALPVVLKLIALIILRKYREVS